MNEHYPFYPEQAVPSSTDSPFIYSKEDTVFAWLSILIGVIVARAVPIAKHSLGMTVSSLLLIALSFAYIKANKLTLSKGGYLVASVAVLFSMGFITAANRAVHAFLFFFIFALFFCLNYFCHGLGGRVLGRHSLNHVIQAVFSIPFTKFIHFFPALVLREKDCRATKTAHTLLWCLAGLGLAVIPTVVIILLLSYDKSFTSLLDSIFTLTFKDVAEMICDLFMGFTAAILIFGSVIGTKRSREKEKGAPRKAVEFNSNVLPRALLCAAVTPILAVYILFFISQWSYYVSAFTGTLPNDLTYAEYARSGFFQLCWVCGINALLLFLFNILIKKKGKKRDPLRSIYSSVISLFTLVLIATALSKMMLYIDSFGLTQKRVYTSWLMILLGVVFIIVLLGQIFRRIPVSTVIAVTAIVFFALVSLPNVDRMIADYNVDAYLSGDLATVDVTAICNLGASGVPALADLREELMAKDTLTDDEETLLYQTRLALSSLNVDLRKESPGIFGYNIPTHRALSILDSIGDELAKEVERS